MDFDFNLILVPLTIAFFAIWLLDKLKLKQRKQRGKGNEHFIITWAYDFWPVLAFVLILRSFFYEPFNIPSDSMVPTLETGDFILVNKFDYGIRLPITNQKIIDIGEPKRGEVFVFRYPVQPSVNFIKRVVGLPGDHLAFHDGKLSVNGKTVETVPTEFNRQKDQISSFRANYALETLGEHQHLIRHLENRNPVVEQYNYAVSTNHENLLPFIAKSDTFVKSDGNDWEVTVPKGHYFAMGDNRDESSDSRFWGVVPEENLAGRAFFIWMHKEPGWHLPSFERDGKIN